MIAEVQGAGELVRAGGTIRSSTAGRRTGPLWVSVWPTAARASALVNMGSTPLRATAVEAALAGGGSVADAAELAAEGAVPPVDNNADASYRTHLAQVLTRRALEAAS